MFQQLKKYRNYILYLALCGLCVYVATLPLGKWRTPVDLLFILLFFYLLVVRDYIEQASDAQKGHLDKFGYSWTNKYFLLNTVALLVMLVVYSSSSNKYFQLLGINLLVWIHSFVLLNNIFVRKPVILKISRDEINVYTGLLYPTSITFEHIVRHSIRSQDLVVYYNGDNSIEIPVSLFSTEEMSQIKECLDRRIAEIG